MGGERVRMGPARGLEGVGGQGNGLERECVCQCCGQAHTLAQRAHTQGTPQADTSASAPPHTRTRAHPITRALLTFSVPPLALGAPPFLVLAAALGMLTARTGVR